MNLPSIFKSAGNMKPSPSQKQPKNNQIYNDVPQDMFGLGIQVFKISSKKDITGGNAHLNSGSSNTNNKSVGKARQDIQVIQNPKRTSAIPVIPKPKKISAILPSITKTPSQKQYKPEQIIKTDSILSRKSAQKQPPVSSKFDPIPQHPCQKPTISKNKTFTTGRQINKSVDAVPHMQVPPSAAPQKHLAKQQWRGSLNILRKFYLQYREFKTNQMTKLGKRKNMEYIGENDGFVDAYVSNNLEGKYFQVEDLYDQYAIQNYQILGKQGFVDMRYGEYSCG